MAIPALVACPVSESADALAACTVPPSCPIPESCCRLANLQAGQRACVVELLGDQDSRLQLEQLGFVCGADVSVLRQVRGDVIVRLGQSRLALTGGLPQDVLVQSV